MTKFTADRDKETLDVLAGHRGDHRQRAVRIEDLDAVLKITQIQATAVSAAPTAAQYNTLLRDVQNIASALGHVSSALQGKLRT